MKIRTTRRSDAPKPPTTATLVQAAIGYKREIANMRRQRTRKLNNGIVCLFRGEFWEAAALGDAIDCLTAQINERILRFNFICKTLRERHP